MNGNAKEKELSGMDIFDKCYRPSLAKEVRAEGIYPFFHALESRQDSEVIMEGKRRIMLGSNNYLGLTTNPEIIEAGVKAIEKYGTGCSGSRFLNGTLLMHLELEEALARFLRKEAVVTFSTGFQSNLGIISAMVGANDYAICDRENHASIYDGCKLSYGEMLRYRHNDMKDLERMLKKVPEEAGCLIITDGVFSMGGDIANLPEIVKLARKYGARVMVDDAHGLGVIGEGGRGTASYFGLENEVDIYMGTFSKSLASLGGYMAANADVADYIRHNSRPFIFSASIPPSNCAVALAALHYLERHPEIIDTLSGLAAYLRAGLKERGLPIRESNTPIIPIYTYETKRTLIKAKQLYDAGVYVNPVLPPATPPTECLLRTSCMVNLTVPLLDEALEIIARVLKDEK
jgi:8-amino-7-oxononanoate synthase